MNVTNSWFAAFLSLAPFLSPELTFFQAATCQNGTNQFQIIIHLYADHIVLHFFRLFASFLICSSLGESGQIAAKTSERRERESEFFRYVVDYCVTAVAAFCWLNTCVKWWVQLSRHCWRLSFCVDGWQAATIDSVRILVTIHQEIPTSIDRNVWMEGEIFSSRPICFFFDSEFRWCWCGLLCFLFSNLLCLWLFCSVLFLIWYHLPSFSPIYTFWIAI